MRKRATYQYSDVLRDLPHEKRMSGTLTSAPSKGQRSNPMKHADIPVETKRRLRKMNVRDLSRYMERAGGPTSPKGRQYAAILEERGVNPNLSKTDPNLARTASNDMFKRAMYASFVDEIEKIANNPPQPQQPMPQANRQMKPKELGLTAAGGVIPQAAIGSVLGGAAGLYGKGLGGAIIGAGIGGALGAVKGHHDVSKSKPVPGYAEAIDFNTKRHSAY